MAVPSSTMACLPSLPQPRRWTGVILVIAVLIWSSETTSAQISAAAGVLAAMTVLLKQLR